MKNYEVVVIGGGLAGLTAAIHLGMAKKRVLVIERNNYPSHKVCGEYVSTEVLPYLNKLGIDLVDAAEIKKLELSTVTGRLLSADLPLGGIGISRYALDFRLYKRAVNTGVDFIFDTVTEITFSNNFFQINTQQGKQVSTPIAIGAFGKRSSLDKLLKRPHFEKPAPWLGVKTHIKFSKHPVNTVGVHAFRGGYGGVSKTESGVVNFCYLAHYNEFKKYSNIDEFNSEVVCENPFLNELLTDGEPLFKKPLSIAQISFESKEAVSHHILMCGDAAGLIHPLCGNGMAMAIHSGKIAATLICRYLEEPSFSRANLEKEYRIAWKSQFSSRLWWGRKLQSALLNPFLSDSLFHIFSSSRVLTTSVIRKTHGKTLEAS